MFIAFHIFFSYIKTMKLQQLRCIHEVARHNLNISAAAEALNTAQPGVSNQIRHLEEELGVQIFIRHGKRLTSTTEAGKRILAMAEKTLSESNNIQRFCRDLSDSTTGKLSIATTHTQARYILPGVIKQFREKYPSISLHIQQGNPDQVASLAANGQVDIAIATEAIQSHPRLTMLPCRKWNRCIAALPGHAILEAEPLTLKEISKYPIITYDFAFTGRSRINEAFEKAKLKPNIVLTAVDSDVIKTYVELGLGIGIVAEMAFSPDNEQTLGVVDASHLFADSTTRIGIRKGTFLRKYIFDFIELFSPNLPPEKVKTMLAEAE